MHGHLEEEVEEAHQAFLQVQVVVEVLSLQLQVEVGEVEHLVGLEEVGEVELLVGLEEAGEVEGQDVHLEGVGEVEVQGVHREEGVGEVVLLNGSSEVVVAEEQ